MSKIVRETASVEPISSEELDIEGNIHRYNFGWMVTRNMVTMGGQGSIPGFITEATVTNISGNDKTFYEVVTQEILPPSLDLPANVSTNTQMESSILIPTYVRTGRKKRSYTKASVFGVSKIVEMGETPFAVIESKEYANAIGGGISVPTTSEVSNHADGGAQYTIANGVKTMTDIKG